MSTPELYLQTAFVLNNDGFITSTREPNPSRGPAFVLVRSKKRCSWAVRVDIPKLISNELRDLAGDEPPVLDVRDPPTNADRYMSLVGGRIDSGPAYMFPHTITQSADIVLVDNLQLLACNFRGWNASEIPGRSPILAILEDGHAVSICFCARSSNFAVEAGLDTAAAFRGRGFGPRVTAGWALAIRASGRIPLYSTSWANNASLAVARKLGLMAYASTWSLSDF